MLVRRLARALDAQGRLGLFELSGDEAQPVQGDLLGETRHMGRPVALSQLTLLPPVMPGKVVGVGSNYRAHAIEMGRPLPVVPKIFLKPSTSVIGHGEAIELPPSSQRVDHEAELAVVIGRAMSRVAPQDVARHIAGYTCCNDVTARDLQKEDGVFTRAKGFDTFCPLGPVMACGLDAADVAVIGRVNGVVRQDGRSSDMVFDVPTLLAFISDVMTLLPGDVVTTGTPAGVGPLVAGDVVEVEVEGVGVLRNPVRARPARLP